MPQAIIKLKEKNDRILSIVKGKYGLKNKSDAVNLIIENYEEEMLEPELRPEYIEKIKRIEKEGYGEAFHSIKELRKKLESH